MADISTSEATSRDIFRLILDHGPLTLYTANQKSSLAIGTIHRHFKQLEETGKITVYQSGKRKKIAYGPAVFGFVYFFGDIELNNRLENYFLLWSENKEFLKILQAEGFDQKQVSENPDKYRKIFVNYIQFLNAIENKIDSIKKGDSEVPRDILIFLSSALLAKDSRYKKIWEDLYVSFPPLRKSVDDYVNNTVSSYREFKKKMKPRIKN